MCLINERYSDYIFSRFIFIIHLMITTSRNASDIDIEILTYTGYTIV
jgi:hypothetical protein